MVEDFLQWVETNNSTLSLRCNYVRLTHTEDTKSFPTVSAATLTTFMRMIKSQTHGKGDVLYTGFWAVTNISPNIVLSVFTPLDVFSDWHKHPGGLCECWLLTSLQFHTVTSNTNQTLFGMFGNRSKINFLLFLQKAFFFLFFFVARSIHHSGLGFKQSNIILNIIRN